ncbi:PREDICTED: trophoblast glycoprotein-like [Nanorana parkeri]|uniref:trophoblast glycoprotein-like n=1 Tax=Nanorana parkeri TaxID=125878 RepID=UPI000854B59B|nr:PREDICTED: trophoblast glycoprotein-like [Nanorana parkeri]
MSPRHPDCHGNLINTPLRFAGADGWLVLRLVGLLVFLGAASSCPINCDCHSKTSLVQCHPSSPQEIPEDYPHWVQNLSITNSNIPILRSSTFRRNGTNLHNLTTLILVNDNLQAIEARAFSDLPRLTTLDMSLNALRNLPGEAFAGLSHLRVLKLNQALGEPSLIFNLPWTQHLRSLQTLEVSGNGLQSFPLALMDLENLQMVHLGNNSIQRLSEEEISVLRDRKIRIYMSLNPFICDCRIRDMVYWLHNSSQTLDAQNLRCSEPPDLNGSLVFNLKVDSMKCKNEDLETASYVFFGIVLALIGVIFLMVLYLNRRGIKRWLNNFREACRDQMEGYHYRYEQDSDPRRSNASTGI